MKIYDLPPELLSEIGSYLDFFDVVSLRQVHIDLSICASNLTSAQSTRTLREATDAHVVWYTLARKYVTRHFNIPRPENGTIDSLETKDLREWVWPRLAIDPIWRKKAVEPTTRILHLHEDTAHLNLIPGGRWLLAVRTTGHQDFYDLNSYEPVSRVLLEPSVPRKCESGPTHLAVDIDHRAPVLEFTFAFSSTGAQCQYLYATTFR